MPVLGPLDAAQYRNTRGERCLGAMRGQPALLCHSPSCLGSIASGSCEASLASSGAPASLGRTS